MVDHHLIADLLPALGLLAFRGKMAGVRLSLLQAAIVLGLALQRKDVAVVAQELSLPVSQALALYNKAIRKFSNAIRTIRETHVRDNELNLSKKQQARDRAKQSRLGAPATKSLADEQNDAARAAQASSAKRKRANSKDDQKHSSILAALEDADGDFAIDDATAARLEVASRGGAAAAPKSGQLLQVPAAPASTKAPKAPEPPAADKKKKHKKSTPKSDKKKRRDS